MDFDLPDEVKIVKRSTRDFAEQVLAPIAQDMDRTGEMPNELIRQMGELGLLGIITPTAYGGSNLGFVARTAALEEISRVSPAMGLCLQVHHMQVGALVDAGTEDQKKKYLPPLSTGEYFGACAITEPTGGSDLLGMTTRATPAEGGYSINGRKCFITNSHLSDSPLVIAKTGEGPRGLSAFIIEKETDGFSRGRHEDKMGLRAANTGELHFRDCRVPAANLIGDEGAGMTIALKTISEVGRPGIAAIALGIIQASYDEAVKFAKERSLYGRPISSLQAIQWGIADIYAELEAARLLCYHASWLKDRDRECAVAMTTAKVYATEAAVRASRKALEIHGAAGTMMAYPIQRLYRDAMVCVSAGGTTEIGKIVMSRHALS